MAHKLTKQELIAEYQKADREGRAWLAKVQNTDEYTLNAIATIHMNAATKIKQHIRNRIGEIEIENAKDAA